MPFFKIEKPQRLAPASRTLQGFSFIFVYCILRLLIDAFARYQTVQNELKRKYRGKKGANKSLVHRSVCNGCRHTEAPWQYGASMLNGGYIIRLSRCPPYW